MKCLHNINLNLSTDYTLIAKILNTRIIGLLAEETNDHQPGDSL